MHKFADSYDGCPWLESDQTVERSGKSQSNGKGDAGKLEKGAMSQGEKIKNKTYKKPANKSIYS